MYIGQDVASGGHRFVVMVCQYFRVNRIDAKY